MTPPLPQAMVPTSWFGMTCDPKTATGVGSSKTPSLSIKVAPPSSPGGAPSSAGWKRKSTVPGTSSLIPISSSAVPRPTVMWTSCPQACITPGFCDFQGTSTASSMGSASMSERQATTGPGLPPSRTATTP